MSDHGLLRGTVLHHRRVPVVHRFVYPLFTVELDVERLDEAPWPLAVDRRGIVAFRRADHGPLDGSDLGRWARQTLREAGMEACDGRIMLVTMPRLLGYLFNPVSFWLCHDRDDRLLAVIAEVRNTFGARCTYVVAHDDGRPLTDDDRIVRSKQMHVSPFLEVRGSYRFGFDRRGGALRITIDHLADGELLLGTALFGRREPLTTGALLRATLRFPLQSLAVMVRIHLQALRLWLKHVPFHGKGGTTMREQEG